MDAADVYLTYCAIKAHFSKNKYDYHKFAGKTKIKRDSFYKRKDRFFFARLARKLKTKKETARYRRRRGQNMCQKQSRGQARHCILLRLLHSHCMILGNLTTCRLCTELLLFFFFLCCRSCSRRTRLNRERVCANCSCRAASWAHLRTGNTAVTLSSR